MLGMLLCACLLVSDVLGARVTFFGSSGKDRMRGNALPNTMWGGRSGDRIFAMGGNDTPARRHGPRHARRR